MKADKRITDEEYFIAKEAIMKYQPIIDAYLKQQQEDFKKAQKEREDNCPEHEYIYTNAKWRSTNERQCINCNKIID